MNIQVVIVILIIIVAVAYVARSMYKSAKGHACETGSCGCDTKPAVSKKVIR
ncbi:MAG: FeoB-associated Cys-rich membrane protein [Bacteroidota bacterium]